jgi:hypothetical protein
MFILGGVHREVESEEGEAKFCTYEQKPDNQAEARIGNPASDGEACVYGESTSVRQEVME